LEYIKYISYDMGLGLHEVKCADDEETDKFQYMSEFGLMNKLDGSKIKKLTQDGEKPMEEHAPFVVQINCWDEERENLYIIGELVLVDGMADAL
jgi:hypothetical protein